MDKREPICFGNGPCFSMGFQHWLQPGIKIGRSCTRLQRLSAWSINQTWDNIIENYELEYPLCPDSTYYSLKNQPFIWKTCLDNFAKYIKINGSIGAHMVNLLTLVLNGILPLVICSILPG